MLYTNELETIFFADVVVAGGGPSGIAAAISAAEMGKKVLVLERAGVVGGCLTTGHVSPISGGHGENTMANRINTYLADTTKYGVNNFENTKIKLTELLDKNGVDVFLNTSVCDVIRENGEIKAVVISTQSGLKAVEGKMFIDATGDGVLSYLAEENVEYGRDDGLVQPTSVMFTITGVDENQPLLCHHEAMDTVLKKGNYLQMCKDACKNGVLPPEIDIVRLYAGPNKGDRVVNATQANGFNPLEPADYTKAQIKLRKQIAIVVKFLKENVEGFENISVKDSSEGIGVRESRRIKGMYTICAQDLIDGKRFEDVIVHNANFPIDIHNPNGAGQAESETLPVKAKPYDVPFRAIVPLINNNLFTAGRCISGSHRAHASYRVMNIAMNIGEAAGVAASLCLDCNMTNKELDYKKVQEVLTGRGIELF